MPYHDINQYNLFTYCNNNPVNDKDEDGQLSWLAKIAIGAIAIAIGVGITALTGGAALPAIAAGAKAALISGAISAGTSATITAVKSVNSGDDLNTTLKKSAASAIDSFADGFMAGGIMAGAGLAIGAIGKTSSGFQIGKTAKSQYGKINIAYGTPKTNGLTLISLQNKAGKRIFSLDFDSLHAIHMHLPKILPGKHIPIGSILSGVYTGARK